MPHGWIILDKPLGLGSTQAVGAVKRVCREAGLGELYLVSTHSFDRINPQDFGFDAALEFAPNNLGLTAITHEMPLERVAEAFDMLEHYRDGAGKIVVTP